MTKYRIISLTIACLAAFSGISAAEQTTSSTEVKAEGLNWLTDYQKATTLAKEQSKPLFLYFTGSDWCGWCKKTDREILSTKEFQEAMGNTFIFVKVDFPQNSEISEEVKKQNDALMNSFKVRGFPTIVLLDPSLKVIGRLGYQAGGGKAFAANLQKTLDAYAKKNPELR